MQPVRMGVICLGAMGTRHAESIAHGRIRGMRLTAVSDRRPDRCVWARAAFPGVRTFADPEAMMRSGAVDAVLIATPHAQHPPLAEAAFAAGLHVLTEKPAGVSVTDVRRMIAAAPTDRVFGVAWDRRTLPIYRRARAIVRSGALGVPRRLVWIVTDWYRTQAYYDSGRWRGTWAGEGGGVLLNQAAHNLDLWQWIFGMPDRLRAFCAFGKYHAVEIEDDATIYAEYKNGATAVFIASTGEYPGTNRLEISGSCGSLVLENGTIRLRQTAAHRSVAETAESPPAPNPQRALLRNFSDAVRLGTPLIAPGASGLPALTLSNAAYLSAWTDDWVTLPVDGAAFDAQLDRHIIRKD